jgi:ADP-ribosyl-[dinitrogen reductase] hydrolase
VAAKRRDEILSSDYVAHSLEAAMWCVGRTGTDDDALCLAANLGDDADTTAAITGQLAGALNGIETIRSAWGMLEWSGLIELKANALFAAGLE